MHTTIALNEKKLNPEDIFIVYDFHDVLVKHDIKQYIIKGLQIFGTGSLLFGLVYVAFGWQGVGAAAILPIVIITDLIYRFSQQDYRHEESVFKKDWLLRPLLPLYIELESLFKLDPAIFKIVKKIDELGIKQMIASNINSGSLNLLKQRYKQSGKFNYFSDILSPTPENGLLNKRKNGGIDFFKELNNRTQDARLVIYIDDKEKNTDLAKRYLGNRCQTHVFTTTNELEIFIDKTIKDHIFLPEKTTSTAIF